MRGVPRHSRTAAGGSATPTTNASAAVTATPRWCASAANVALRHGAGSVSQTWYAPADVPRAQAAERLAGQGLAGRRLLATRAQDAPPRSRRGSSPPPPPWSGARRPTW